MEFPPNENSAVVELLVADEILVQNYSQFFHSLGLPPSELIQLRNAFQTSTITVYELFYQIITRWRSRLNTPLKQLCPILEQMGFLKVSEQLRTCLHHQSNKRLVHIGVGEEPNHFVGRSNELRLLDENFTANKITVVTGMGGIGKSELVRNFAKSKQSEANCIWLNGESEISLFNAVMKTADEMGINTTVEKHQQEVSDIFPNVLKKLCETKLLLVLDNVVKENVLVFQLISVAKAHTTCIIITSRNLDVIGDAGECIDLDPLGTVNAMQLVSESIQSNENVDDIKQLCSILESFPLALHQAIGFIKRQKRLSTKGSAYKVSDYVKTFNEHKVKYLSYPLNPIEHQYKLTTLATWDISIDTIKNTKETGNLSIQLLDMMAYLDPAGIQLSFLSQIFRKVSNDSNLEIEQPILLIKEYCLVKVVDQIISIHRLVQEALRLKKAESQELEILHKLLSGIEFENMTKQMIPHSLYVWEYSMKYPQLVRDFPRVAHHIAERLLNFSLYTHMFNFTSVNLALLPNVLGKADPNTLVMQRLLASALKAKGKYDEALFIFEELSLQQEALLGIEDGATLTTLQNKAKVLKHMKRYDEAFSVFQSVLKQRRETLGENHADVVATQVGIASVLMDQRNGSESEAVEILENVWQWRKKNLGDGHPLTLTVMSNIATCMYRKGQPQQALEMLQQVWELRVKLQGEEHSDTLKAKSDLAWRICQNGDKSKALQMFNEILGLRENILGKEHPNTVRTANRIKHLQSLSKEGNVSRQIK